MFVMTMISFISSAPVRSTSETEKTLSRLSESTYATYVEMVKYSNMHLLVVYCTLVLYIFIESKAKFQIRKYASCNEAKRRHRETSSYKHCSPGCTR